MFVLSTTIVFSQEITGTVVDDMDGTPIPYANIVLKNNLDSSYVSGTISNIDGQFSIPVLNRKESFISVSYVGYESKNISLGNDENIIVSLKQEAISLDGIIITAALPRTQMKGDVLVTNVDNSALAKLGTARNVLAKIPGVIEQNGSLEVFGKGSPLIYINRKKIQNINELNRLNADNIKNIEVITNPGARYASDANAVIRIITKKSDEGFGVSIRTDNEFSHYYSGKHQLDFNLNSNKIELFGMLKVDKTKQRSTINSSQITYAESVWKIQNSRKSIDKNNDYIGKVGISFIPNEKHAFGLSYLYEKNKCVETQTHNSTIYEDLSPYDNCKNEGLSTDEMHPKHEINTYYNASLGKLAIDFNADYLFIKSNNIQKQSETSLNFDNRTITTLYNKRNKLLAEKLILSYPFYFGELSIGEEYSFTERENSFYNKENILNSNNNGIQEKNLSSFIEQSLTFGRVRMILGLRNEHIQSNYDDGNSKWNKTYNNFFPSFSLSAPIGNVNISLGYNVKTTRPSYSQLDGNISYVNKFNYLTGNPYLQPVKRYSGITTVSYKWIYLMANFTHSTNEIIYCSNAMENDSKISLVSYKNIDRLDKLTLYCSLSPQFSIWKPTLNFGYIQQWLEMPYLGSSKKFNRPIFLVQLYNALELPFDYTLRFDGSYIGKGNNQNMLLNEQLKFNFSINKSLFKDKLNISLDCNDIFGTYKFKPILYNTQLLINQENINDTRSLVFSLTYKLNSTKNKYKGSGAGNSEKDRL